MKTPDITDRLLEQRLRAWYRAEIGQDESAPLTLRRDVVVIPRWSVRRTGLFGRGRGVTLFAAAALLLLGGAAAASGLLRLPSLVPQVALPTFAPLPSLSAVPARAPSWAATGSMITPRFKSTAVLLPDGKVLALGGMNGNASLRSAELYDPATGTWTATGSMVTHAGDGITATLLRDGNVLVAGWNRSAELYDPVTGTWITTGTMVTPPGPRSTATLLPDGKVLVLSGEFGHTVASAELYDPATGTWTTASLAPSVYGHMATLLRDGRVLVAGGVTGASAGDSVTSAVLYDPTTGSWTATGTMGAGHTDDTATLLPDGRVLVGGAPELYDPATGTWTAIGGTVIAWFNGPGVLLSNGGVVVPGAAKLVEDSPSQMAAYLFDPGAGSWTPAGNMAVHRYGYTATLLPDGKVLVAGGSDADVAANASGALASAELFDPGTWSPSPIVSAGPGIGTDGLVGLTSAVLYQPQVRGTP